MRSGERPVSPPARASTPTSRAPRRSSSEPRAPAWLEARGLPARSGLVRRIACCESPAGRRRCRSSVSRREQLQSTLVRDARHRNGQPRVADRERRARRLGAGAVRPPELAEVRGRRAAPQRLAARDRIPRGAHRDRRRSTVSHRFASLDVLVPFIGVYRPFWLGPGNAGVRSDPRARDHEPAARTAGVSSLARGALGGLRGMAARAGTRPRHRKRHARSLGSRRQRRSAWPWCSPRC